MPMLLLKLCEFCNAALEFGSSIGGRTVVGVAFPKVGVGVDGGAAARSARRVVQWSFWGG